MRLLFRLAGSTIRHIRHWFPSATMRFAQQGLVPALRGVDGQKVHRARPVKNGSKLGKYMPSSPIYVNVQIELRPISYLVNSLRTSPWWKVPQTYNRDWLFRSMPAVT